MTVSLSDWFQGKDATDDDNNKNGTNKVQDDDTTSKRRRIDDDKASLSSTKPLPRVLLLDGGVSTHLEHIIESSASADDQDENQNDTRSTDEPSNDTCHSCKTTDKEEDKVPGVFQYPQLWSSSLLLNDVGKAQIKQGHLDWLKAGSHCISTVTYQCHYYPKTWPPKAALTPAKMDQLWYQGLQLAFQARTEYYQTQQQQQQQQENQEQSHPVFVIASSGCFGAALANGAEYTGDYGKDITRQDLVDFHRKKIQAIRRASTKLQQEMPQHTASNVDTIAIETVPSLLECQALVDLLNNENPNKTDNQDNETPVWISLACRNESELNDGTALTEALRVLRNANQQLQAIGLNCCDSLHLPSLATIVWRELYDLATRQQQQQQAKQQETTTTITTANRRGLVLYPNSGEVWDSPTQTWKHGTGCTTPEEMAQRLIKVIEKLDGLWEEWCQKEPQDESSFKTLPKPRILVGGCCRTTPATITALRQKLDDHLTGSSR